MADLPSGRLSSTRSIPLSGQVVPQYSIAVALGQIGGLAAMMGTATTAGPISKAPIVTEPATILRAIFMSIFPTWNYRLISDIPSRPATAR